MAEIPKLSDLDIAARGALAVELLTEQVVEQRRMLHYWRSMTKQPAQIDTGYVGQHLVSLVTGIEGGGFRGKGLDLADGSECKAANFLDSMDAQGATAPRWNFQSNDAPSMEALLGVGSIYLVSVDVNSKDKVRARIWELWPSKNTVFRDRYLEWMDKIGKPKLLDPGRPYANFQVFPPRNRENETHARHGGGNSVPKLPRIQIPLEDGVGARLIFHAEETDAGPVTVLTCDV